MMGLTLGVIVSESLIFGGDIFLQHVIAHLFLHEHEPKLEIRKYDIILRYPSI